MTWVDFFYLLDKPIMLIAIQINIRFKTDNANKTTIICYTFQYIVQTAPIYDVCYPLIVVNNY